MAKTPRPPRQRTLVIRQFITEMVGNHPDDIAKRTSEQFKITRQAAWQHLRWLADHGVLKCSGKTAARKYELVPLGELHTVLATDGLAEDVPWRELVAPLLDDVPGNVSAICNTAFTEMLNNAIDHSGSDRVQIDVLRTAATVSIKIRDFGIGVFKKIKDSCGLNDERDAILELGKGKLTTEPAKHSGFGVYFTSRMVDLFAMSSGKLFFTHIQPDDDWLMEVDRVPIEGTLVEFVVSTSTKRTTSEVWDRFCESPDSDAGFLRTHVPIRLAQYGNEHLVSRSQAKRVLTRFDRFREVLLDFKGVEFIGQAFADEIFRVYAVDNQDVKIGFTNANQQVTAMIQTALKTKKDPQMKLFVP